MMATKSKIDSVAPTKPSSSPMTAKMCIRDRQYPDLCVALDVPYDSEGSAVGVAKGNDGLMAKVNEAIAAALADGSMDQFVAEANELAAGDTASLVDGEIVADEK